MENEKEEEPMTQPSRDSENPIAKTLIKEEEETNNNRTCLNKLFGELTPGSVRGGIFNLSILSLGTGCLALPQKFHAMTLIGSPIIIILAGIVNCWSLYILSTMAHKYDTKSYSELACKTQGKKLSKLLGGAIIVFIFGLIIIYQVILYKLIGGIINELGGYGFISLDEFLNVSFWKEYIYKFPVSYGCALVFLPLCLLKDISKMRFSSVFGIGSFFLLIGIILAQSPWYIKDFINNHPNEHYNFWDISVGFDSKMNFLKSCATLFYAYSCHMGAFPVMVSLTRSSDKRTKKIFRRAIILDAICYMIVGVVGYLSMPIDTPDLIIERKSIFGSDWVMTIGRSSFIFTLLMKIPVHYNAFRFAVLELFDMDTKTFSNKL